MKYMTNEQRDEFLTLLQSKTLDFSSEDTKEKIDSLLRNLHLVDVLDNPTEKSIRDLYFSRNYDIYVPNRSRDNIYNIGYDGVKSNVHYGLYNIEIGEYELKTVDSYGGEGQGESFWAILSCKNTVTGEETFWKFDGYYTSYDGGYLENVFQVFPKEVTVTNWVNIL